MEKINIAELLKDCPSGMELDCTMYDNCTLEIVFEGCLYPIQIRTPEGLMNLTKYGGMSQSTHSKCVIFPKGKTTWEGFVPPIKFKDGDIVFSGVDLIFNSDDYKVKELTMQEIADKFGIKVGQLRIKE